jgi:hypothetical protein
MEAAQIRCCYRIPKKQYILRVTICPYLPITYYRAACSLLLVTALAAMQMVLDVFFPLIHLSNRRGKEAIPLPLQQMLAGAPSAPCGASRAVKHRQVYHARALGQHARVRAD